MKRVALLGQRLSVVLIAAAPVLASRTPGIANTLRNIRPSESAEMSSAWRRSCRRDGEQDGRDAGELQSSSRSSTARVMIAQDG